MLKKSILSGLFVALAFCFVCAAVSAEGTKAEMMAKLKDLREKKLEMTEEYEANLKKIEKEAEEKMAEIKKSYRIAHDECLADRHNKSEALRKDYEGKLKPVIKEEGELTELVGRDAREDFAKPKWKRTE